MVYKHKNSRKVTVKSSIKFFKLKTIYKEVKVSRIITWQLINQQVLKIVFLSL